MKHSENFGMSDEDIEYSRLKIVTIILVAAGVVMTSYLAWIAIRAIVSAILA